MRNALRHGVERGQRRLDRGDAVSEPDMDMTPRIGRGKEADVAKPLPWIACSTEDEKRRLWSEHQNPCTSPESKNAGKRHAASTVTVFAPSE
jgi:hypothetical protein